MLKVDAFNIEENCQSFNKNFKDLNKELLKESRNAILSDGFDKKSNNPNNPLAQMIKSRFLQTLAKKIDLQHKNGKPQTYSKDKSNNNHLN